MSLSSIVLPDRRAAGWLLVALTSGVLASGSSVALLATSAWLISAAAAQPPVLVLMVAIVAVRAFGIGRGMFRYVQRLAGHDAAYRLLARTRARMTDRLEELAPAGLDLRRGDLLARLLLDVDCVLDLWLRVVLPVVVAAVTATATVALIGALQPVIGVQVGFAVLVACIIVPWLTAATARHAERSIAKGRGEVAARASESLQSAADLVAFGAVDDVICAFADADVRLAAAERRSAWSAGLGNALLVLCVGGATVSGLVVGSRSHLAGPTLAVLVLTPLALLDVLGEIPPAAQIAVRVRGSLDRLREVLAAPRPVTGPARPHPLPRDRSLRIHGLRAGYGDGPDVLQVGDIDVPEGGRVIITGPSGSGKSTLAAVLLRLLDPRAGEVNLGGFDLTQLDSEKVRSAIGLLTQDCYVFDTSIRENLLLACPDASDLQLWNALHRARLGDFVERLPRQLGTMVGERGARLSGGERQRLAFARLLLARHDVLILDEPTEHLDEETARALLMDLFGAAGSRTVVLLTHRPELVPHPLPQIVRLSRRTQC
ncbi:thiol reductant ABC exporter subunit CydC [Kribbella sp. VKM Ac-2566]|uniref:thiol reductant ABC exporter subunit CydC n=1 Tax=Kribbella sp. VKM Ac-2566 TaxID=2512218 RepID=UPI001062EEE7|nr:thiol reductant ABC exporter subunit CydC [Kribbella sp. VKM Ac-2566]TDW79489.1 ATP-binding cassette subfamily C protein CydC [Kribbella sp. VKM Ac-2566]